MKPTTRELTIFAMLGAVMYASKIIMEFAPNIHLIGVFTVAFTVVYRKKALFPIYVYVLLTGMFYGFASWWLPYLYIWAALWGAVMLLPRNMPKKIRPLVYMAVCSAHGFLYLDALRACAGASVWAELPKNDCLDYRRPAL